MFEGAVNALRTRSVSRTRAARWALGACLGAASLGLASGCGQKGPLYLPQKTKTTIAPAASGPAPESAPALGTAPAPGATPGAVQPPSTTLPPGATPNAPR
jgi:predicted small lipoprotein YifL